MDFADSSQNIVNTIPHLKANLVRKYISVEKSTKINENVRQITWRTD